MPATLTTPAPVETEKSGAYLHDRSRIPAGPPDTADAFLRRNVALLAGLVFTLALAALVVQTRAAWHTHRDWVPPAGVMGMAFGGLAVAHLLVRRRVDAAAAALLLVVLAAVIALFNILRGYQTDGGDALRDVMSIATTVLMGASVVAALIGFVYVEATSPTKAPQPEL